jgi:hypothetical protein
MNRKRRYFFGTKTYVVVCPLLLHITPQQHEGASGIKLNTIILSMPNPMIIIKFRHFILLEIVSGIIWVEVSVGLRKGPDLVARR